MAGLWLALDGASWAVSCPGFGQVSPGQGQAAAGPVVARSAWLGISWIGVPRPHGGPTETPRLWVWGEWGLGCCSGALPPHPHPGGAGMLVGWDWKDAPNPPP